MSVSTEITRLAEAKAAIKTAIEGKGVTVPDNALLGAYAALIEGIQAGGGGYNFDGNPRWISSGEFTPASTITVTNLDPILFTPSVMSGDITDAGRGRYFFLFDTTKTKGVYTSYTGLMKEIPTYSVVMAVNYLFRWQNEIKEFTIFAYNGGNYLMADREYGYSNYEQIQFGKTTYKFAAGHRYCWVAFGMKAGDEQ